MVLILNGAMYVFIVPQSKKKQIVIEDVLLKNLDLPASSSIPMRIHKNSRSRFTIISEENFRVVVKRL